MRMIRIMCVSMGLLCLANAAGGEEKVVANHLDVDPGLRIAKGEQPDKKPFIEAVFFIPSTGGKNFIMEFDLKITRFNHYAEVYVGLGNSGTERKSYIWLNKGDDGVARCHFRISSGPDFTSEAAKPFEGDVTAGRHYRMEYNALKRSVEWLVSDAAGRELHRSEPIKSTGPFAADQIWFRVITSQNWKGTDLSGIYYDPVGRWILLRSHICTEGHYPYLIECRFDNLVVRYFD